MKEYLKVYWLHEPDGYPQILFYEIDPNQDRRALRCINVYADGRVRSLADPYEGARTISPIPSLTQLNNHIWGDEIRAQSITPSEFEDVWNRTRYDLPTSGSNSFWESHDFT